MPIASGAAGRVEVGVDTSTTWTADGVKTKPSRNYDSYLQRYQEQRKRNKASLLQEITNPIQENDGIKERDPRGNGSSKDPTPGKPPSGGRSKKSLLCVLL